MESVLSHWYGPDDSETEKFYTAGTIALDANILLSLYRVNGAQRQQIMEALEKVADRLWIPYQVALEYQRNRLEVAAEVNKTFDSIEAIPDGELKEIMDNACNAVRKLAVKTSQTLRDRDIRGTVSEEFEQTEAGLRDFMRSRQSEMAKSFKSVRENHTIKFEDVMRNDPVRTALDKILKRDNIGMAPSKEVLAERRSQANSRIKAKTPPGYKDAESKADPTGDCLIWFELLDHATAAKRPVLFVTDDVKEDFYVRVYGKTVGPRTEMVEEMLNVSGQKYHQTTLDSFLRSANAYLNASVEKETISAVRSAMESQRFPDSEEFLSESEYKLLKTLITEVKRPSSLTKMSDSLTSNLLERGINTAKRLDDVEMYNGLRRYERRYSTESKERVALMRSRIFDTDYANVDTASQLAERRREYQLALEANDPIPRLDSAIALVDALASSNKLQEAFFVCSDSLSYIDMLPAGDRTSLVDKMRTRLDHNILHLYHAIKPDSAQ